MRKITKKCTMIGAFSLLLALSSTGVMFATKTASAEGTISVENGVATTGFEMVKGATVGVNGDATTLSGMRFEANVSEAFKTYLSDTYKDANFTYGSLVDYKGRDIATLLVGANDTFIKEVDHTTTSIKIDETKPEFSRTINYFATDVTPTEEQLQAALDLELSARYYVKVDFADETKDDVVIYAKASDNTRSARAIMNEYVIEIETPMELPEAAKISATKTAIKGDLELNVSDGDYEAVIVDDLADGTYSVYYNAKKMGEVVASNGSVTLPFGAASKASNDNVFTLQGSDKTMKNYTATVVDKVIKTADEFKTLLPQATNQHYVLGNDIEKVENYPCPYGVNFTGVLDGRGYSVEEISYKYYSDWWIYGSLFWTFNGTIKNISFDNMSLRYSSQNAITYDVADGNATLENVFINATTTVPAPMFGGAWADANITLKNVVVFMNCTKESGSYAIMGTDRIYTIKNATDVYVSGSLVDGSAVPMSPSGDIPGCTYKTTTELLAMANNSEFATDILNKAVLANVKYVVDKTATQSYYVENWTTEGVTLTNAHNKPVFVAHDNLSDLGNTTIQKIVANDVDLGYNAETGELDASKLTKGTATWNVYYSDGEVYKVTVNVVDAIIKDATDFKEILPYAKTEHIVLGNDIEKVAGYPCPYGVKFTGVLDGRGYSVGEISYSFYKDWYVYGWLFYSFNGTIKNISFDKVTVQGATTFDNRQSGIAYQVENGNALLENVFMNVTTPTGAQVNAMFGTAWGDAYITLRNVVAIVNGTGAGTPYAIIGAEDRNYTIKNATNVYVSGVMGNGNATPMSPSGDIAGCTYKTQAELLAMANAGDATLTDMAKVAIKEALGE